MLASSPSGFAIDTTSPGRQPVPTPAMAKPCTIRMRKPALAPYVGCHRIATTLPAMAPAARQASAIPSQWAPHPEPLTRRATPSPVTGVTKTFSAVSPTTKSMAVSWPRR